jgi:hypothetical protein
MGLSGFSMSGLIAQPMRSMTISRISSRVRLEAWGLHEEGDAFVDFCAVTGRRCPFTGFVWEMMFMFNPWPLRLRGRAALLVLGIECKAKRRRARAHEAWQSNVKGSGK